MSEQLTQNGPEHLKTPEISQEHLDKLQNEAAEKAKHDSEKRPSIEHISRQVEQSAISGKEYAKPEHTEHKQHPVLVNKHLKEMSYARAMVRVRKHLSIPSKAFSKVVHSKVLDRPSEVIGKTIARPSGMLGGAFFAAVGSSILLWITKHYGYEYSYLAVILLFGIGLFVGLGLEAVLKVLKKR